MNTTIYFEKEESQFLESIAEKNYAQIVILADAKTNGFCVPVFKKLMPSFLNTSLIIIPDGEQNKTLESCKLVWDFLIQINATKNTLLINIGGGMVCDLGGFIAATFKRGIDYINVPTTLLAMNDACLGGKTAVDYNDIKNIIGVIKYPIAVYIYPIFLNSLSEKIKISGIAEMIKHAALQSKEVWNNICKMSLDNFEKIEMIQQSLLFKKSIVTQDALDENVRQVLNFGHTIGHAIESESMNQKERLLHGEAIMLGMIYEAMLSHELLEFDKKYIGDLIELKNKFFPFLNMNIEFDTIKKFLLQDKKNTESVVMSLLHDIGECKIKINVSEEQIKNAILETNKMLQVSEHSL